MRKDGSIDSIYCHWDGYPEHNGSILASNYSSLKKINDLIDLGDLSYLDEKIKPTTKNHTFDDPESGVTIAYKRDRGEENTEHITHKNYKEFEKYCINSDQEFAYLYKDKKWQVASIPWRVNSDSKLEFRNLKDVLKELNIRIDTKDVCL